MKILILLTISVFSIKSLAAQCLSNGIFEKEFGRNGVVIIRDTIDGNPAKGVGFIYARLNDYAYIITSSHVVENVESSKCQLIFYSAQNDPIIGEIIKWEGQDINGLAVVKTVEPIRTEFTCLLLNDTSELTVEDNLFVIGSYRDWLFPWEIKSEEFIGADGKFIAITNLSNMNAGFSGSPIIKDDKVVGLVVEIDPIKGRIIGINSEVINSTIKGWNLPTQSDLGHTVIYDRNYPYGIMRFNSNFGGILYNNGDRIGEIYPQKDFEIAKIKNGIITIEIVDIRYRWEFIVEIFPGRIHFIKPDIKCRTKQPPMLN